MVELTKAQKQQKVFKNAFDLFDQGGKGEINQEDLRAVLNSLGQDPTEKELFDMIKSVDKDASGTIDFDEFCTMMSEAVPEGSVKDTTLIRKDDAKLDSDIEYRYQYIAEFIGLTAADIRLIHASHKVIGTKLDDIVAECFKKLWSFNVTKQVFFKFDKTGTLATVDLSRAGTGKDKWQMMSEQLKVQRLLTLKDFLEKIICNPYEKELFEEMDKLGRIHSTKGGHINAPLLHVKVMLGFLQDEILAALFHHKSSYYESFNAPAAARAYAKVFTVIGDYFSKHYV